MTHDDQTARPISRRTFLKRTTALTGGALSARGIYEVLDTLAGAGPQRVAAAPAARRREQYLIENLEVILDNGQTVVIPPLHNDVFTAQLSQRLSWTPSTLKNAQARLEKALQYVESPYPATAAGLTIVVGWGLPYLTRYVPSLWAAQAPVDKTLTASTGTTQYAVLDATTFPSDPAGVVLEDNQVMFKFRSDSQAILQQVEYELFEHSGGPAYVGDLFDVTSKRIGFLGRGFNQPSIAKTLLQQTNPTLAAQIPDKAQLTMGFTSTQTVALGPDNIVSFETLPGVTDYPLNGYFAGGCAMHLSHLNEDLATWYGSFDYSKRVARMFSPRMSVPSDPTTVTIPNGPAQVSTIADVKQDAATYGILGHNATLQTATRLAADVVDRYGRLRPKGTAIPVREDFNTLDNPFAWTPTTGTIPATNPGMHFVAFVPASSRFHRARNAMDGVLPDGTNLRPTISDANNGFNAMIHATHRQNFLIPPRAHRSFPLAELLK